MAAPTLWPDAHADPCPTLYCRKGRGHKSRHTGLTDAEKIAALVAALKLAEHQLRSWHISTKPASKVDVRVQEALDAARAAFALAKGAPEATR